MRKRILALFLAIIVAISFSSCRADMDTLWMEKPVYWSDLFDTYWTKMSTNYLFWFLDYNEGHDWDLIYDAYYSAFEELGRIENNNTDKAIELFTELIMNLSDNHYALQIENDSKIYTITTLHTKLLKSKGFSEEEIKAFFKLASDEREEINRFKDF